MRKLFEPRMAHSANLVGDYIVCFGGFNSQSTQYSPNLLNLLSLSGVTDFILSSVKTSKMMMISQISEENEETQDLKI